MASRIVWTGLGFIAGAAWGAWHGYIRGVADALTDEGQSGG